MKQNVNKAMVCVIGLGYVGLPLAGVYNRVEDKQAGFTYRTL